MCVKVINKEKLQHVDTPWRDHLNIEDGIQPFCGSFHKPPLLHSIIAVDAFMSVLNPTVQDKCPFS